MRIYVVCDLEGTAGVIDHRQQCWFDGAYYPQARRLATLELNALVEGALEGGATEIVAWDGHGNFPGGLDVELVHPRCRLVMGAGDGGPVGFDSSFDALFLCGLHAMQGTDNSVLAHSFWPGVMAVWLNDIKIGEVGMAIAQAGWLGVPAAFISGDRAGVEEARALVPGIQGVAVKEGLAPTRITPEGIQPSVGISLAPEEARRVIREGARRAMGRIAAIHPFRLEPPFTLRTRFFVKELADGEAAHPGVQRIDELTVEKSGDDLMKL